MGILALGEGKRSLQMLSQSLSLLLCLDCSQNLCVDSNLILLPLLGWFVSFLLAIKDVSLLLGGLLSLYSGKVFVIDGIRNLDSRDINLGGCGQQKSLVHSSQRSSIQFERSSDQQKSSLQLLEDNKLSFPCELQPRR